MTTVVGTDAVERISAVLRADGLVALPTETVYGLAARAASATAVARIFAVKGRPADNPLIVHCADAAEALALGRDVPAYGERLAAALWPGPLTLVLRSAVEWPWVQAGHPTIAVRVPAPAYLRRVLAAVGPVAAPSANRSGRPSPTTAAHCVADLEGLVDLIVDGGPCAEGLESTVVDCTGPRPAVLRPGPVSAERVRDLAQGLAEHGAAASPGTRHPHYRPRARVVLVDDLNGVPRAPDRAARAMFIGPEPAPAGLDAGAWRGWSSVADLGRNLYAWLREADALGFDVIYVERVPETGLGAALMNRLRRAAGA